MSNSKNNMILAQRLNAIRAAVLGSNDGILGAAGVIFGVMGTKVSTKEFLIAGITEMLAVALSMSSGEYVSVSSQRDAEVHAEKQARMLLTTNRLELVGQLKEKCKIKGLSKSTIDELVDGMPDEILLRTHLKEVDNIDIGNYLNPIQAATSSLIASMIGAIFPIIAAVFFPENIKLVGIILATLLALFLTGYISAKTGKTKWLPAVIRNVFWGVATMIVTFILGMYFSSK